MNYSPSSPTEPDMMEVTWHTGMSLKGSWPREVLCLLYQVQAKPGTPAPILQLELELRAGRRSPKFTQPEAQPDVGLLPAH